MSREPLTFGSLFAGVGGFDLGLERAGMVCRWQVEIDPFARKVLKKHWPDVKRYGDIRECGENLERVDVICGGFPCQDISTAGPKEGLAGQRSGLWREYARIVGLLRPRYVVVENVAELLARGMGDVLGDLAALGYDAEWHCVQASAAGAPIGRRGRDRVWIVAYPDSGGLERARLSRIAQVQLVGGAPRRGGDVARLPGAASDHWQVEPDVGRVADGVPDRVDRLRAVGNAVVPQIPEWIGKQIIAYEASRNPEGA